MTVTAIYLAWALLFFALSVFLYLSFKAYSLHRGIPEDAILEVAVAGSGSGNIRVRLPRALSGFSYTQNNGERVKLDTYQGYRRFIVTGHSMILCGIDENDVVFVKPTNANDVKFPSLLVLRRSYVDANEAQYKIRRSWALYNPSKDGKIKDFVKLLMESEAFSKIRQVNEFPKDRQAVLSDLEKRYNKFVATRGKNETAIISTTLHNGRHEENSPDFGKVLFSVHPLDSLVGTVEHVYRSNNLTNS